MNLVWKLYIHGVMSKHNNNSTDPVVTQSIQITLLAFQWTMYI
jgi:hypothetical protein